MIRPSNGWAAYRDTMINSLITMNYLIMHSDQCDLSAKDEARRVKELLERNLLSSEQLRVSLDRAVSNYIKK